MPKFYEINFDLSQIKLNSLKAVEARRQMSKEIAKKLRETPLNKASLIDESRYLRSQHGMKGPQDNELSQSKVIFIVDDQERITDFGSGVMLCVQANGLYMKNTNMFCFNMDNEIINKSIFMAEDDIVYNNLT